MTMISLNYANRNLGMIQNVPEVKDVWEKYPVHLNICETEALKLDLVMPILDGEDLSPATLAGIKVDQIASPLIVKIGNDYKQAKIDYKSLLKLATENDFLAIEHNSQYHIKEKYHGFWWLWAIFGCSFISREQFNRDAQAHRFTWLVKVDILESVRLRGVKNLIENSFPVILEQLEDMSAKKQTNIDLCMKAWQLKKVYNTLFPGEVFAYDSALGKLLPDDAKMNSELLIYKTKM